MCLIVVNVLYCSDCVLGWSILYLVSASSYPGHIINVDIHMSYIVLTYSLHDITFVSTAIL